MATGEDPKPLLTRKPLNRFSPNEDKMSKGRYSMPRLVCREGRQRREGGKTEERGREGGKVREERG